ncbi:MCE family protein [Mycobacterium sp. 236(2023)]|uniref:MCE family protein n=1 Tax=Mycobacterium sp. 236(2023) TaxID=3038163 RepID=UPI00241538AB|nr:MCE family protein [Mycobacterium sp. 236(2023)]MDG4668179.1 MCE family protein [Mycobacterium sp. 236(2023)]
MIKYRHSKMMRAGVLGFVLIVLVIAVGLQPERIITWAASLRYQAEFLDAGGLAVGDEVRISGVKVGSVSDISWHEGDALVTFTVDGGHTLGTDTTAHIRTGTLLGQRVLTLEPAGATTMRPLQVIPTSRTASPYSLTQAVNEFTANTAGTDTASLNQSLDTLATTIGQIAPELGPTFDGLSRLSSSINGRNENLTQLLANTDKVTTVLAERSNEANSLILNANDLLAVLVERRQAIANLLADTSALALHIKGMIADNEAELAPTLDKLNTLNAMLEKNRDNIAKALPGLTKYQTTLSEIVANGPFYQAFVPNLIPASVLQPFLDYAFGFRRGVEAGHPPDDAGPRAELDLPFNGIPLTPQPPR